MRVTFLLASLLAVASGQFFYYPQVPHNYAFQHPVVSTYNAQTPGAVFFKPSVQAFSYEPKFRFANPTEEVETLNAVDAPIAAVPVIASHVPTVFAVQPTNVYHNFHTQDDTGAYSYGYSGGSSSKHEVRDSFGNVHGAFNYVDPEGNVQSQRYVAGVNGFQVAATNLPEAPLAPVVAPLVAPVPVQETPEVQRARFEHTRLFEAAANAASKPQGRTKRSADPAFAYATTYTDPLNYKGFPASNSYNTFRANSFQGFPSNTQPLTYGAVPTPAVVQPFAYSNPHFFPTVSFSPKSHVQPLTYTAAAAPQNFVSPFFPSPFPFTFRAAQTAPVTYSKVVHSPGQAETIVATN